MKNSYLFNKSLPTKNLWRLAYNESLWVHLMKAKYLDGCSMDDWLHLEHNSSKNNSIVWKALVEAFLVGNWTIWCIGNGMKIKIGEDPWVSVDENFRLSEDLIRTLHAEGIFSLYDVRSHLKIRSER